MSSDIIKIDIDDTEGVTFKVTLDDLTVARLMEVADSCHADPRVVIAALVRDILEDDAQAHGSQSDDGFMLLQ